MNHSKSVCQLEMKSTASSEEEEDGDSESELESEAEPETGEAGGTFPEPGRGTGDGGLERTRAGLWIGLEGSRSRIDCVPRRRGESSPPKKGLESPRCVGSGWILEDPLA